MTIEAEQWTGLLDDLPDEWLELDMISVDTATGEAIVHTLEGLSTARMGDYIVRGVAGELYPVKRPIFRDKYQIADDPDDDPAEDAAFEQATQATREAMEKWAAREEQP